MSKQKYCATIYTNGATIRLKNRALHIEEFGDAVGLCFIKVAEKDQRPTCSSITNGKLVETKLMLSVEAMEAIVQTYTEYRRRKYLREKQTKSPTP